MYLNFPCSNCGTALEVPEDAGRWVQCPHCQSNVEVPKDADYVPEFIKTETRGARSREDAGPIEVRGNQLTCPVCGGENFWSRRTLMNTSGMTFFKLDWANKEAQNHICNRCGYVFWFLDD